MLYKCFSFEFCRMNHGSFYTYLRVFSGMGFCRFGSSAPLRLREVGKRLIAMHPWVRAMTSSSAIDRKESSASCGGRKGLSGAERTSAGKTDWSPSWAAFVGPRDWCRLIWIGNFIDPQAFLLVGSALNSVPVQKGLRLGLNRVGKSIGRSHSGRSCVRIHLLCFRSQF